jgi:hypothetical protein
MNANTPRCVLQAVTQPTETPESVNPPPPAGAYFVDRWQTASATARFSASNAASKTTT